MSKLFPPKIEIDIYNDGFEGKDLLNRKKTGERLSELVERIEDPMVIALNGGWGTGKSFFLKCWVGEHTREESRTAKTVYFDAFAHDYLDNPLIALTEVLAERVVQEDPTHGLFLKNVKSITPKLVQAGLRIALAAGTSGLSEASGAAAKAVIEATGTELTNSVDIFLKQEDGKKAAMKEFSATLKELTQPKTEEGGPQKIVIVIDELDRCRPDYALQMLEIIKHFFSVPHVHFILGVNLHELENSVKARYGADVNAAIYMQKFITLSMSLPSKENSFGRETLSEKYFRELASKMELSGKALNLGQAFLELPGITPLLSLRSVERIITHLALLPIKNTSGREAFDRLESGKQDVIVTLIVMKILQPDLYQETKDGKLSINKLDAFIGKNESDADQQPSYVTHLHELWLYLLTGWHDEEYAKRIYQTFGHDLADGRPNFIANQIETYIETFDVS